MRPQPLPTRTQPSFGERFAGCECRRRAPGRNANKSLADWLREKVAQKPDATLVELVAPAAAERAWEIPDAIEGAGAEVRNPPPYSPDLNPIELALSKFKRALREGARRPQDRLVKLSGGVLGLFTETEIRYYFTHGGYRYA